VIICIPFVIQFLRINSQVYFCYELNQLSSLFSNPLFHALKEGAILVTKEEKITATNTTKIKIPNVCDNMKVPWINDFQLVEELNIQFSCRIE
jgi:hypothetical protein